MSSISQSIPNLLLGISQQPDNRKRPGQVKDALNVFPDFALGMLKRPGGAYVSTLKDAQNKGKYFPILRDPVNRYVAQFDDTNGQFRVWGLSDGIQRAVDMGTNTGQPTACSITGNGPEWSSLITQAQTGSMGNLNQGFDGNVEGTGITFSTAGAANSSVTLTFNSTFDVRYQVLHIYVNDHVSSVVYDGTTINTYGNPGWYLLDVASGYENLASKEFTLNPDNSGNVGFAGFRIDDWKVLLDNDPNWNLAGAVANLQARTTAKKTAAKNLLDATAELADVRDNLNPKAYSYFKTDFRKQVNPIENEFGEHRREHLVSGVLEREDGTTIYKKDDVELTGVANYLEIETIGDNLVFGTHTGLEVVNTTRSGASGLTVDVSVSNASATSVSINTNGTGYFHGDVLEIVSSDFISASPLGATAVQPTFQVGGIEKGTERTDQHPALASGILRTDVYPVVNSIGQKVYELVEHAAPTKTTIDENVASSNVTSAGIGDLSASNALVYAEKFRDFFQDDCDISASPSNAYLKDADPDDLEFVTFNDYTIVVNKKKVVAMTTDKSPVAQKKGIVVISIAANNTAYTVKLTPAGGSEIDFSHPSGGGASPSGIATGLATLIDANANFTATSSGPTVIIESATSPAVDFSIATEGGDQVESLFGFTNEINNITNLPVHCEHNYVVKVNNSQSTTLDDMFVKFTLSSGTSGSGVGQWNETIAPDTELRFDPLTMPHQLVNNADGTFTFGPISWIDRLVGDDDTNPLPSFVGHTISNAFFYRNRLGFTSDQNVVLSAAGDVFNFFVDSARVASDADPIDISAEGKQPAFLKYVNPTSVGLVLYSDNEQFLLATDSDVLTPSSAKVNRLSAYECDAQLDSVSLGTSQAFVSKTPLYTRVFELSDISNDRPPLMSDITDTIPELMPKSLNSFVASPSMSMVSLAEVNKSDIYQYRFLTGERDERVLNSWYRWRVNGTLLSQFFDASTFFTVTCSNVAEGSLNKEIGGVHAITLGSTTTPFTVSSILDVTITTTENGSGVDGRVLTDSNGDVSVLLISAAGTGYEIGDSLEITETNGGEDAGVATATVASLNHEIIVQSFDMGQSSEQGFLTLQSGEKTDVCLDLFSVNPGRSYNSASQQTSIALPYLGVEGGDLRVVVLDSYVNASSSIADQQGSVYTPTITNSNGEYLATVDGDVAGRNIVIGYNYNMEIELPKLYRYRIENQNVVNDDVSSLVLHRLKFKTGLSGPVDYKVTIEGVPEWDNVASVTRPSTYTLNSVNMQASATHVVPVFQRNENLAVKIVGNTPFPVSLLGLDWEGKFNQRFYRRS